MTTPRHQRASQRDWEAIDFVIAFRARGLTWAKLSANAGYKNTGLRNVVDRRWPKGERVVAEALGVSPDAIWPSRYPSRQAAA